jgi:hypothetical protein
MHILNNNSNKQEGEEKEMHHAMLSVVWDLSRL